MSSPSVNINFAQFAGYSSVAAAAVFTVLYAPLFLLFVGKSISRPTYVHFVLAFFCAIRVGAFAIRAIMIKVESAGETLGLLIADQILFGIGYAGLLYSGYTLVMDLADNGPSHTVDNLPLLRFTGNRHLFRLAMAAAVTMGIVASSSVHSDGTAGSTSTTLREASTGVFLALTLVLFLRAIILKENNMSASREASIGAKHSQFFLLFISVLLLVREIYITATVTPASHAKQLNEVYWYPLVAVPEILAVLLFAAPGLVPSRQEISQHHTQKNTTGLV